MNMITTITTIHDPILKRKIELNLNQESICVLERIRPS